MNTHIEKNVLYEYQFLRILIAFFCGTFGTLAFSPFDFWLAALCSLFGLQFLIINRSSKKSGFIAFFWGLGLFGSGVNWIYVSIADFGGTSSLVNLSLIVLLTVYLSFYPVVFSYLLNRFFPRLNAARFFLLLQQYGK